MVTNFIMTFIYNIRILDFSFQKVALMLKVNLQVLIIINFNVNNLQVIIIIVFDLIIIIFIFNIIKFIDFIIISIMIVN